MKIKGFDKDLKCREFQFEIGKTYDTGAMDNEISLCSDKVFHYCDNLKKVHNYYSVRIRIVREIVGEELDIMRGMVNENTGVFNTGNRNTGDFNTGNRNTGDWNTGNFNRCNHSTGFFCTVEAKARVFDAEIEMTVSEFRRSKYYRMLIKYPFTLTEWVDYSEEEKAADKEKELVGGYLKRYTYKEACANWWALYSKDERAVIMSMPNFDAEKFKLITGIDVEAEK